MFEILIIVSVLVFGVDHATSTANCHELHKSQLISLNDRMTQMIDTISSLLPKPINKTKHLISPTPASSVDFVPSSSPHETTYSAPLPTYTAQPPQIMYMSPPHVVVSPPVQGHQTISSPQLYFNTEAALQPGCGPPVSAPRLSRSNYQYEKYRQCPNFIPMVIPYPSPCSYQSISPSMNPDYSHTSVPEYPLTVPALPSISSYMPGQYYLPMQIYPTFSEQYSSKHV